MADRIEREIEEILERLGEKPRSPQPSRRRAADARAPIRTERLRRIVDGISAGEVALFGIIAFFAAYFLRFITPALARYVVLLSLTLLTLACALALRRGVDRLSVLQRRALREGTRPEDWLTLWHEWLRWWVGRGPIR